MKKRSSFFRGWFLLILLGAAGAGGYYAGTHQETVVQNIQQGLPQARSWLEEQSPRIKNTLHHTAGGAKRIARYGLEKGRDLYTRGKTFVLKENTAGQTVLQRTDSPVSEDGAITIASFNIRIFSNNSRNDQELEHIAAILSQYDITAIQEIRDEQALRRTISILDRMGYPYAYDISPPVGRGVKERYAFLYRKDKITQLAPGKLYPEKGDEFIREPYYASFRAGNFDFTLLTIHLLYGDNERHRRPELLALADVYRYVQDSQPEEHDIILLGDFNFPPTDVGWEQLKMQPAMAHLIDHPQTTTITDTSLYDNFWFQQHFVREYDGEQGILKFDETIFRNNDRQAKLMVSDHRPVWAKFRTNLPDDD